MMYVLTSFRLLNSRSRRSPRLTARNVWYLCASSAVVGCATTGRTGRRERALVARQQPTDQLRARGCEPQAADVDPVDADAARQPVVVAAVVGVDRRRACDEGDEHDAEDHDEQALLPRAAASDFPLLEHVHLHLPLEACTETRKMRNSRRRICA